MEMTLNNGHKVYFDDEDAELVLSYSWVVEKRGGMLYARGVKKGEGASKAKKVYMHRLLLSPPENLDVDHRDRDGLNNRRGNIAAVSRSTNSHNKVKAKNNTSGAKGVYYSKERGKWFAKLVSEGKEYKRGYFTTVEEAAEAYVDLAFDTLGPLARLDSSYPLGV